MASLIFSTFTSLKPLTLRSVLRVAVWTDLHGVVRFWTLCREGSELTDSNSVVAIGFELRDVCRTDT